jgi:hypothetical protein
LQPCVLLNNTNSRYQTRREANQIGTASQGMTCQKKLRQIC